MTLPQPVFFFSNRMGRIILLAMEEILGQREGNDVLRYAGLPEYVDQYSSCNQDLKFPFEHLSRFQAGLEDVYGPRAGRGLGWRIGRASLKYVLQDFGHDLGLTDPAFRFLPLPARLKGGTEALADLFNRFTDQRVWLEMDGKQIYWHIERCPLCWQRKTDGPCCTLAVGLIQEALCWMSGGKYYLVEEKNCVACGDSKCTLVIDRIPLS
jgi:predicted hydrocarbon binding protein